MERLLDAVDAAFPVPPRFRAGLPRDVASLSLALTAERSDRDGGYLGKPAELSAYLRYFLPWNVFRLARLLPSLPLELNDGDALTDIGSGPLTVPIALWLSRPELRERRLEIRCLDRTGKVLDAGATLFAALSGGTSTWKIRTIRGPVGARVEGPKAALTTAANVLNEIFWDDRHPVAEQAERKAAYLAGLAREDGQVLIVEPGIPRSGEFVSALRRAFIATGRAALSPCPHGGACPLPGGRRGAKWCHFAFETDEAPARLLRLSAAAGIPKERATLSFLLAGAGTVSAAEAGAPDRSTPGAPIAPARKPLPGGSRVAARVVSDAFPLQGGAYGRYACCGKGLALVSGGRGAVESIRSGTLLDLPAPAGAARRDEKSGALILELESRRDQR